MVLPIFVDIAPGGLPERPMDSWNPYWVDITNDVRVAQGISVEEGIPNEANQADPGSCTLTVDNGISRVPATVGRVGCYSPRNPAGPYWGALAKNTPLRVRVPRGTDSFARTRTGGTGWGTSESGIAWSSTTGLGTDGTRGFMTASVATTAVNAGTWDFDFTSAVEISALPGTGNSKIMSVNFRRNGSANTYTFRIDFQGDNTLALYIQRTLVSVGSTLASATTPGIPTYAINTKYNIRLKAEGGFIGAKIWIATDPEGADWAITAEQEAAYNLDNTLLGTNIQLSGAQIGTPPATTLYWYPITINWYPFIGTVPEWPVRWDKSTKDSTAPLKVTGVLRRLQQGRTPLRSPLYSFMDSLSPSALWMLEDQSGATVAASQTPGVKGAYIFSTSPSGWDTPLLDGTAGQFTVSNNTTISSTVPALTPQGAWSAWFTFYMPVLPVTNPILFQIRSSGTIAQWYVMCSDDFGGVLYLAGLNPDGTVIINHSIVYTPGQWCIAKVDVVQTGGTFTGTLTKYQIGDGATTTASSSAISGAIGTPQGWAVYGSTGFQAGAAGPVAFWPNIPSITTNQLLDAARGFAGESAGTRIERLCAERNVRLDLLAGGTPTLMGPQSSDAFLSVLGEAADTDLGLLTEFRGGLRYRARGRRYGQNSRMTLDMALGQVAEPPEPTDDDQRLRNDVTVTRKNGASARAYDSQSIALHGTYDTSVDINPLTDADLPGHASFRLYLGTWDELRWPSITIDLLKNAGVSNFLERATALEPGAYIIVSNPPTNLPVGTLRLLVESVKQTLGPFEWRMELTCTAYGPWRIPDTGATVVARMDLVGSTLGSTEVATAVGATDTWTVTNSGRAWNTTDVPYDWVVNGEVVTVTAISGTSSQTATVTRGVGGFTKAHSVGELITLSVPFYVSL
jgi:hypothetical protein